MVTRNGLSRSFASSRPPLFGRTEVRPTVGLLTAHLRDPYATVVWSGVTEVARERDANVVCLVGSRLDSSIPTEAPSRVIYDLVDLAQLDGLVVFSEMLYHFTTPELLRRFLDRYGPLPRTSIGILEGIPSVMLDIKEGMRQIIAHLVEVHGYRRLALLRGPKGEATAEAEYRSYLEMLAHYGIPLDERLVTPASPGWGRELGFEGVRVLLDERQLAPGRDFEALIGCADIEVMAGVEALAQRGVSVPNDVAVTGYNNLEAARFATPGLTTVDRRIAEISRQATHLLLDMIEGHDVPEKVLLPPEVIVRRSCGCMPQLVVEAAAVGHPGATPGRHRAAPEGRRPAILAALTAAGRPEAVGHIVNLDPDWPARLLDSFFAELDSDQNGAFLAVIESIMRAVTASDGPVSVWQTVLSTLRQECWPWMDQAETLTRAENLWQQARVLVADTAEREQGRDKLTAADQVATLSDITHSLITTFDVAGLMDVLAHELPRLGIPTCYLFRYDNPLQPAEGAYLALGYNTWGRLSIHPGVKRFAARHLVPEGILPAGRFDLVALPIYFQDEQMGFIVLEMGPRDGRVYEALRTQVSSALKGALLMTYNARLYQEALHARAAAEEASRLKSRFLSTVSHELRTPLSLIIGTIEMMLEGNTVTGQHTLPEVYRRDLDSVRGSAQHLVHLIGDVLDLASSEVGQLRLACEPLNLGKVLHQVDLLGQPLARERGLAWRAEIPNGIPLVWGDRTRLQQVALNLVANALKFTERGEILLQATIGQGEVTVSVSDTGMGISPAEQEAIFDEFRQSERTAGRGYGGMGLGLAISRRLVEMHGGHIAVRSSGKEGAGSTFSFTLPTIDGPAGEDEPLRGRGDTVLLLTEATAGGEPLRAHLIGRGFQVEVLSILDRPDWLAAIIADPPGAIILDIEPATERGWELMQLLKQNPETREMPVLFYQLSEEKGCGALLEMNYLTKPVGTADLMRALAREGMGHDGKTGCTIMIVDDEPCILDLHARMVGAHVPGCQILTAHDGRAALELLARMPVDLVLLDLMMPEVDGFAVLQAMQDRDTTRNIPVIVLTAQILTDQDMARLQQGVTAVLGKGLFSTSEVLSQIETALARSKRLGNDGQRVARRIMAYIHEHYVEPILIEELAAHVALSRRHVDRCFSQETGVSPITYLNRYRIRQARALLERGDQSITEVALAVGFSDISYFSRVFRQEIGASPAAFRRGQR